MVEVLENEPLDAEALKLEMSAARRLSFIPEFGGSPREPRSAGSSSNAMGSPSLSPTILPSRSDIRRVSISNKRYQQVMEHRKHSSDHLHLADHMRAAAIMLSQLTANAKAFGKPEEQLALRDRILKEMTLLEDKRVKEMKMANIVEGESYEISENDATLAKEDPSAVVLKESWDEKEARIRASSPFGTRANWRLCSVIVKSGADLRQEQLACQLIREFICIWNEAQVPCWLH